MISIRLLTIVVVFCSFSSKLIAQNVLSFETFRSADGDCYQGEEVEYSFNANYIYLSVYSASRSDTPLVYQVVHEGDLTSYSTHFNANGFAEFAVRQFAGVGTIFILDECKNRLSKPVNYASNVVDDAISIAELSGSQVSIIGTNPVRINGDEITVSDVRSGKAWNTTYLNNLYSVVVPVVPGMNNFTVSRPSNRGLQQIEVQINNTCRPTADLTLSKFAGTLQFLNNCNSDSATVTYAGSQYRVYLSSVGELVFPLQCGTISGAWSIDGTTEEFVTSHECRQDTIDVVLQWDAPVDLDLHIQEKIGAKIGGAGWIYQGFRNVNLRDGGGTLVKDCDESKCRGALEEIYIAELSALGNRKYLNAIVDYASRDQVERPSQRPKYTCGEGPHARVGYTLTWTIGGKTEQWKNFVTRIDCDSMNSRRWKSGNKSIRLR